jgi:lysophospholipase L1-like esterase
VHQFRILKIKYIGTDLSPQKIDWHDQAYIFDRSHISADNVMIGDSITERGKWPDIFSTLFVVNRGVQGDTTGGVLERLNGIAKVKAKRIFIMIGFNDFDQGVDPDRVFANYKTIINTLSADGIEVFVQSTLYCNSSIYKGNGVTINMNITFLNERLKTLTSRSVHFVDINTALSQGSELNPKYTVDGVHINGDGYFLWGQQLSKFILRDNICP